MLRTRGKRVVAEATIPDALLKRVMRSNSELMFRARAGRRTSAASWPA